MHPYLKERIRDLRNHGFCILEKQLIEEDETIWGGYSVDEFNDKAYEILGAEIFFEERANGDMVVRKPKNAQERLQIMIDAKNALNDQANQAQFMTRHGVLQ